MFSVRIFKKLASNQLKVRKNGENSRDYQIFFYKNLYNDLTGFLKINSLSMK